MAKQPMLKFVSVDRDMPEKRQAETRREDFDEIYAEYADAKAKEQASRCSQCGVPYCQTHCPLHNNIPDWLRLTATGRLEEAYQMSQATNTFPEICGRICPQDRLCEGNCVIEQSGHGTVTIGSVEKYITDTAWENGWVKPAAPAVERPESVGIIGGGPGGLAAADMLRQAGIQVTVYDRYDRAGGLLTYGIPGFKLEKDVVMRRIQQLKDGGVEFVMDCDVDADIFATIQAEHDAVIIATGVYKSRDLQMPGSGAQGIEKAIDFLVASNRKSFGDAVEDYDNGRLSADGKRVVVIGGGDTAMDCVRTSIREGAVSVKCLYRRDRANMPGSQREVANAEEEGVVFEWLSAPKGFTDDNGKVSGVMVQKMRLGAPDASGRQAPEVIEGADYVEEADLVIKALGFEPEDMQTMFGKPELAVTRWGTIKAQFTTGETEIPGVYAVGDIVRGASLVVWAIKDGRDCAEAILKKLNAPAAVAAE
ncbi:NAD(P)-dependent oxidoreductase [Falsiphaeobacter marinintestinus]|uniref:NAD(P)-dependent oxidoreductase n=1 Tax=Falsiphaeobacter marinintestinus TaxID=1492905 RepID=UPI0011B35C94|nr:NAD(P)-dependent oxidoreductase [Phaeobacter marinintestinus]